MKDTIILCLAGVGAVTILASACIFKGINGAITKGAYTAIGIIVGYGLGWFGGKKK